MKNWFLLIRRKLGSRLVFGVLWSFATLFSGAALLMLSGWFISATALAGISIAAGISIMFDMYMPGSGIRFFALSRTVSRYAERLYNHDSILRLISVFRLTLFSSMTGMSNASLRSTNDSEWLAKLTADLDALDAILLRYTIVPIAIFLLILSVTFFVGFFYLELAIVLGIVMLVFLCASIFATVKLTKVHAYKTSALLSDCSENLIEHLSGALELQAFNMMLHHEQKLTQSMASFYAVQKSLNKKVANIQLIVDSALGLVTVSLIVLGMYSANMGLITGPFAVLLVMMFMAMTELLQGIPSQFSSWGQTEFAVARLNSLLHETPMPNHKIEHDTQSLDVHIKGHPQILSSQHNGLQFTLLPQQIVNVTGHSGSGKSSIAKFIIDMGKYESPLNESDNYVLLNQSIDLSHLSSIDWYSRISYLEQANTLLAGSLGYNLALGISDVSEKDLWRVLKIVELEQWANKLPEGLNTWLGEMGANVSGGQARRICLARLLLRDSPIIILDEPFNGLDEEMSKRIWLSMQTWLSNKMVLLLSHHTPEYLLDVPASNTATNMSSKLTSISLN